MTDAPGTTLEKPIPLAGLIEQYAGEFGKSLPAHIGQDRYARWCVTFLKGAMSGGQREAWERVLSAPAGQLSVMHAFMDCASLGLEPGRTYHLVPFGSEVTGITDYKGEIELIFRAGNYPVVAQIVRAEDDFHMVGANVPPRHDAGDWFGDRGVIVGGYAYGQLGPDLYSQVVHMSEAEFRRRIEKLRNKTVATDWPEQWRLKTLIHQLRKFMPWSAEVRP